MPKFVNNIIAIAAITAIVFSAPVSARAGSVRVASNVPVADAVSRLTAAVEKAGARVFSIINFTEGAVSAGVDIRPTAVVIFGSPKIGAKALTVGQTMGLYLPLRVLAYEDEAGKVWLMYNDPADAAVTHGIPADHPAIIRMQGALEKMTKIASGS